MLNQSPPTAADATSAAASQAVDDAPDTVPAAGLIWSRAPRLLDLTVRTDIAYRIGIAELFTAELDKLLGLRDEVTGIRLALHEAVANAVLHGNMGISDGRASVDAFGDFCAQIEQRLRDPEVQARTVGLSARWTEAHLHISVTDQGNGFSETGHRASDVAAYGRGLLLMREFARSATWHQRRRTLELVFDRTDVRRSTVNPGPC